MNNTTQSPVFPALSALETLQKRQVKHWLLLALASIAFSGLAPLLLLAGRASFVAEMEAVKQWFVPVLVIHVNLSVGLWFLALAMLLWRWLWPIKLPYGWHGGSVLSFLAGILAMVLAPLAEGEAFTSNYIPVQNNPLFFFGLSLIFVSLLLMIVPYLYAILRQKKEVEESWIPPIVLTLISALACFIFSILQHPSGYSGEPYYEAIWWAGGHILQFLYVQIGVLAWLWLAQYCQLSLPPKRWIKAGMWLLALSAMMSPLIYWLVDINSYYHIKFFSWQMNVVTGTLPGLLAFWLFLKLFSLPHGGKGYSASFWVLLSSLVLFLSGGLVGFLIEGSNTIIPAHYHGSTVGVTLALMGAAYLTLPLLGKADVSQWKMAKWQPVLYGAGQLLHVIGFAIAGSEGAGRKVAGSMEGASELAQAGMQLVRLGGVLAVLGGAFFVIVMIRAWRRDSTAQHRPNLISNADHFSDNE
jgi:hypothetical protein